MLLDNPTGHWFPITPLGHGPVPGPPLTVDDFAETPPWTPWQTSKSRSLQVDKLRTSCMYIYICDYIGLYDIIWFCLILYDFIWCYMIMYIYIYMYVYDDIDIYTIYDMTKSIYVWHLVVCSYSRFDGFAPLSLLHSIAKNLLEPSARLHIFHQLHDLGNEKCAEKYIASHFQLVSFTWPKPSLVGGWATPLKNMSSSIGMISNPIWMGKFKIDGNQTTNQISPKHDSLFGRSHRSDRDRFWGQPQRPRRSQQRSVLRRCQGSHWTPNSEAKRKACSLGGVCQGKPHEKPREARCQLRWIRTNIWMKGFMLDVAGHLKLEFWEYGVQSYVSSQWRANWDTSI